MLTTNKNCFAKKKKKKDFRQTNINFLNCKQISEYPYLTHWEGDCWKTGKAGNELDYNVISPCPHLNSANTNSTKTIVRERPRALEVAQKKMASKSKVNKDKEKVVLQRHVMPRVRI